MMNYETMNLSELRTKAREVFANHASGTSWIVVATKARLLEALTTGEPVFSSLQQNATHATPGGAVNDLALALERAIGAVKTSSVDMEEVDKRIAVLEGKLTSTLPRELIVTVNLAEPVNVGHQHKMFPVMLKWLALGKAVYLCGESGSGKSEGAHAAARALNLPYYPQSVCAQTSKTDILGYLQPGTGDLVRTPFRNAYENGGVYGLDEIDAGNANVTLILNSALSNGGCMFPDGYITRHPDFKLVATANTFGAGSNRQYVGRNPIDSATLTRFAFIAWDIDPDFERALAGNDEWVDRVQALRASATALQSRILICPRASIDGARAIAAGLFTPEECEEALIFAGAGIDADTKAKIKAGVKK